MFRTFANVKSASRSFINVTSNVRGFFPFQVKLSKSSELNDARFDSLCLQKIIQFGICRDKIFSNAFTGVFWYPWIRKVWLMLWLVFCLLTFCEELVLPVSVDYSTATRAAFIVSTFLQVVFKASPTFWFTRTVNLFFMFFKMSRTSRVDSSFETLASVLPGMKMSRF